MPSAGFEPATPKPKRPQTYALNRGPLGSAVQYITDYKYDELSPQAVHKNTSRQLLRVTSE
jgi:hypothetical protein